MPSSRLTCPLQLNFHWCHTYITQITDIWATTLFPSFIWTRWIQYNSVLIWDMLLKIASWQTTSWGLTYLHKIRFNVWDHFWISLIVIYFFMTDLKMLSDFSSQIDVISHLSTVLFQALDVSNAFSLLELIWLPSRS